MIVMEIVPHVGIGPVRLGSLREHARAAMASAGLPLESSNRSSDYYAGASIQVEHGPGDLVRFIGVSPNLAISPTYRGVDVFKVSAPDLFARIAAADNSGSHTYTPAEYLFPNQLVTLWEADEQYDQCGETKPVWAQVGVGSSDYAAAVAAIKAKA